MFADTKKTVTASGLITLALLLWGWQNNILLLAIILSLPLICAHWLRWRLDISDKNFNRIADITSIFFFLFIVFQFSTKSAHGIFAILAALPYLFYPLILTQYFSQSGNVPLQSLFISMRKRSSGLNEIEKINLNYPYLLVVLISSSAGNKHSLFFYICICVLAALSLYSIRPGRVKAYVWVALFILSIGMGYATQNGLKIVQSQLEEIASTFLNQMMWRNRNPDKTRTAFGYIGRLKLSDQIHVRVKTDEVLKGPLLLREASYTNFKFGLWINEDTGFETIDPARRREWVFDEPNSDLDKYTISTYFNDDMAIIPIPHETVKINNVPATDAEMNQFGAVNLEMKPGWVRYDAHFDDVMLGESPGEGDLVIHEYYEPTLIKLANELDLYSKTPTEIIHTVENYFKNNFTYSLTQYRRMKGKNRLEDFLYHRREGHCEYFATATTLLLRAAGIPTRYTVGYSVQEYSSFEDQYVARARDAHSWAIAYVNDKWIVLDNTPGVWAPLEAQDESWWQPISDLWSWLGYSFTTWKDYSEDRNNLTMQILLFFVIVYFFWRLLTDSRFIKIRQSLVNQNSITKVPGLDSPIYRLTGKLEEQGHKKLQGETLSSWLLRQETIFKKQLILPLLDLHYRYRFDPIGLTNVELKEFENQVMQCLDAEITTN